MAEVVRPDTASLTAWEGLAVVPSIKPIARLRSSVVGSVSWLTPNIGTESCFAGMPNR
jgi:hypothetical protein